jgi:hypothetical protein
MEIITQLAQSIKQLNDVDLTEFQNKMEGEVEFFE